MPYKDKEKQRAASRRHYARNKDNMKARAAAFNIKARARNRQVVIDTLTGRACVDCGIANIRVLEFDHIRGPKLFNIADGVFRPVGLKKLKAEIEKCEIRCANCHRIKTCNERNTDYILPE